MAAAFPANHPGFPCFPTSRSRRRRFWSTSSLYKGSSWFIDANKSKTHSYASDTRGTEFQTRLTTTDRLTTTTNPRHTWYKPHANWWGSTKRYFLFRYLCATYTRCVCPPRRSFPSPGGHGLRLCHAFSFQLEKGCEFAQVCS